MDAPPPPAAPPTTPGPIPDPRAGRLPAAAKTVAWLNIAYGGMMLLVAFDRDPETFLYASAMTIFIPLGIGVLLRSHLVRLLARIAHGLMGGVLTLGLVFTVWGMLTGGLQGQSVTGGLMVAIMVFLMAWLLGLTTFYVWGFFVLGREDVRAACKQSPSSTA